MDRSTGLGLPQLPGGYQGQQAQQGQHQKGFAERSDTGRAAGARDEGQPGPRPEYGEPYYGCFVRDLDGHKIEATYWDEALMHSLYGTPA